MTARYLLPLLAGLVACDPGVSDDLPAWAELMRDAAREPAGELSPEPAAAPVVYDPAGRSDPFDAGRLASEATSSPDPQRPDRGRRRDPLEAYALESLRMVGSLSRHDRRIALVAADNQVYPVGLGDFLGQDFGQVVAISEEAIDIDERVQEADGRWSRRRTRLSLRPAGAR